MLRPNRFVVLLIVCLLGLAGGGAVIYGQTDGAAQAPALAANASNAQICTRIVQCDPEARDATEFRKDCPDFLKRSAARFPVQFEPFSQCVRTTRCENLRTRWCLRSFFTAIDLDLGSIIRWPQIPKTRHGPIRKLANWPTQIPEPDEAELARIKRICESSLACPGAQQNPGATTQSHKYCGEWLKTIRRAKPEEYPVAAICLERHPCSQTERYKCIVQETKAAEEALKRTPEYKAALREIQPYCDRVRECHRSTSEADRELSGDPGALCENFLIRLGKFPDHREELTSCLKTEECTPQLFSTCVKKSWMFSSQ